MDDTEHPPHLTPLEPTEAVTSLCDRILAMDGLPPHVRLEARAFRETQTPHDARRLRNALKYSLMAALADDVTALLEGA